MVFPRGLCVALTLWMACSRPSAPFQAGSLHPESWWAAKEFSDVLANEAKLRASGDLGGLETLYRSAYAAALRLGNPLTQTRYLVRLGNTHFLPGSVTPTRWPTICKPGSWPAPLVTGPILS